MRKLYRRIMQKLTLENFTTFMALLGQCASYIQAFKIFYVRSAYSISITAWLIGISSGLTWLAYGIAKNIKPLIISNIFGLGGGLFILLGIIYYHGQ